MTITREQITETLQNGWGIYAAHFHQLSPQAQAAELSRQGYARFPDLLAHVLGWWERALAEIPLMLADPAYRAPDVDVDTFNVRAVAALRDFDEPAVQRSFDDTRQALIDLVAGLPAPAFEDERIAWRLDIEVIGHLKEHELSNHTAI